MIELYDVPKSLRDCKTLVDVYAHLWVYGVDLEAALINRLYEELEKNGIDTMKL